MISERRILENFDWVFLALILALAGLGILNLYSASSSAQAGGTPAYLKQFYWLIFGLGAMTSLLFFDYHRLSNLAYILYGSGLLLLITVLVLGRLTTSGRKYFLTSPSAVVIF